MRGAYFAPSPSHHILRVAGQIYKISTAFDRPGKLIEGNPLSLSSGPPMTSQVRSKSKCLTTCHVWFRHALSEACWMLDGVTMWPYRLKPAGPIHSNHHDEAPSVSAHRVAGAVTQCGRLSAHRPANCAGGVQLLNISATMSELALSRVAKFFFSYGVACRKKFRLRGVRCGKK